MEKRKYHYEYAAYTCNLYYGRQLIVRDRSRSYVNMVAYNSGKGVYEIERVRVYED